MANKNQKIENKPEEQPTTPAPQVELTDEQLEQVTGGFNPQPDPPGVTFPPGPGVRRDGIIMDG
jgi:mersacidin/lichenicidin family type 2 lantibiotic